MVSPSARILIPVDFNPPSAEALRAGYALAERFGADLRVLHATRLPAYVEPELAVRLATHGTSNTLETLARDAASRRLDRLLTEHPPPPGLSVQRSVEYGEPLDRVQLQAEDHDMVVVGTHGRTGIDHLFVGSVAERIVRHVDRPIWVARRAEAGIRSVLVAVDFSDPSRFAFSWGAFIAKAFGADLFLVHVVPLLPSLELAELMVVGGGDKPVVPLRDYANWRACEDVQHFLKPFEESLPTATDVRTGDPATEIIHVAKARAADLVVLGTHGRSDWAWVGVGSVAERVVRAAPCSVLTTRWSVGSFDTSKTAQRPATTQTTGSDPIGASDHSRHI